MNQTIEKRNKIHLKATEIAFKNQEKANLIINYIENYVPNNKFSTSYYLDFFKNKISSQLYDQIISMDIKEKYTGLDLKKYLRTGEKKIDESNSELASKALSNLLNKSNIDKNEIDFLITVTDTSDYISPGLSNQLIFKNELRRNIKHVSTVGMGCSALIKALDLANDFIKANPNKTAAIVISVLNSKYCQNLMNIEKFYTVKEIQANNITNKNLHLNNWLKLTQFFLFGDAASALIVSSKKNKSTLNLQLTNTHHITNIEEEDITLAYFSENSDSEYPVFFMDKRLPIKGVKYSKILLKKASDDLKEIKKWAIHTGSKKIIKLIARELGLKENIVSHSYDILNKYGNITPCSLPFILESFSKDLNEDESIALLGFGNGFSASLGTLKKV